MANEFPVKILAVTSKNTASKDACYAELDKILDDNPLSEIVTVLDGGYLPDMTKAIKLENAIYRVNVPGYFYHHTKNPNTIEDTTAGTKTGPNTKDSGILMSCYASLIDTFIGLNLREHFCASMGGVEGESGAKYNRLEPYHKGSNFNFSKSGDNISVNLKSPSTPGTDDGAIITTPKLEVALPIDLRYGEVSKNSYRTTYVVNNGNNDVGVMANNMIPVVPGRGSTQEISGANIIVDKNVKAIQKFETTPAKTGKDNTYVDDNGKKHEGGTATFVNVSQINKNGMYEGKGTYVYWYRMSDDANDEYLFIPCAGVSSAAKPLTKIRNCFRRFNTTIPSGGKIYLDIAFWHFCYDPASYHSKHQWALLRRDAERKALGISNSKFNADANRGPSSDKNKYVDGLATWYLYMYCNWFNPDSGQRDAKFRWTTGSKHHPALVGAFSNQTIKPQTGKFLVQRYFKLPGLEWNAREVYPSDAIKPSQKQSGGVRFSCKYWDNNWAQTVTQYIRDYTLFNPVTDGVDKEQYISARYSSQKDVPL